MTTPDEVDVEYPDGTVLPYPPDLAERLVTNHPDAHVIGPCHD